MDCEKWRLGSGQVHACIQSYKGVSKVHLRNFRMVRSGKWLPTVKGVTLDREEWEHLKSLVQVIDLEFRKQLSKRVETSESRLPWYHEVREIPQKPALEIVCPSPEANN